MEKNTVILSLDEYNDLRDFKINVEENHKTIVIRYGFGHYDKKFITTEKAIEEIAELNTVYKNRIIELTDDPKIFDPIKKMSIWEFIKWRRK